MDSTPSAADISPEQLEELMNNARLFWDFMHESEALSAKVAAKSPGYKHPDEWVLTADHRKIIAMKSEEYKARRNTWCSGISFLLMCTIKHPYNPRKCPCCSGLTIGESLMGQVEYTTTVRLTCSKWLSECIRLGWDNKYNHFLRRNSTPKDCIDIMVIPLNGDQLYDLKPSYQIGGQENCAPPSNHIIQ